MAIGDQWWRSTLVAGGRPSLTIAGPPVNGDDRQSTGGSTVAMWQLRQHVGPIYVDSVLGYEKEKMKCCQIKHKFPKQASSQSLVYDDQRLRYRATVKGVRQAITNTSADPFHCNAPLRKEDVTS
nr:transmembrane protein [Tanacetum cinerariifolium]